MDQAPRWMHRTERVLDGLGLLCMLLASIALVVLVVTFGCLVFGLYVLNVTPTWVEQLALLLICYITYLGAAVGIHENTHLGVTLFREMTGDTINTLLKLVIDVVLAVFGLIMLVASIELVQFGWGFLAALWCWACLWHSPWGSRRHRVLVRRIPVADHVPVVGFGHFRFCGGGYFGAGVDPDSGDEGARLSRGLRGECDRHIVDRGHRHSAQS